MDMSNFRPELHVAQQSRRDKLRIQQDNAHTHPLHHHNFSVYANNLDQVGNICYDPSEFSLEMLNFSVSQGMLAQKDGNLMAHHQEEPEKRAGLEGSFESFSRTIPNPSATVSSDPQYFSCTWKSIGSQSNTDHWVTNNQTPMFVGEGLSAGSQLRIMNSANHLDVKPYLGYDQEFQSSEVYQNTLQELVTSSSVRSFVPERLASLRQRGSEETSHGGPWGVGGGELVLLKNPSDLISRPADVCHVQWSGDQMDFAATRNNGNNNADNFCNTQALSLSLSSVPSPKVHATQVAEKDTAALDLTDHIQESGTWKPEYLSSSNSNVSGGGRVVGNARQDMMTHRNPGPLGPFTGYATILRNSKFLRPAQQLLDELCCAGRPKNVEMCEVPDRISEAVRVSGDVVGNAEPAVRAMVGDSGGSSFAFNGSSDKCREPGGMSCSTDSYRPENLQKKAKLIFLQDEVCKRYKQYHQQMQMVASSFESVVGLSAATPYVSLALKMVSKHFRCLKNAITDQLKSIRNALGEDLSSPSAGTSSSKGDASGVSMLKFFDQSFQKQKSAGSLGILEGHHIWRPQRGLPEHAVSILRAWLFDHFLHPYPTDTDKHMLATQTGLTRNQVSNWFINARVRVWKPMVEEIHMLETKGVVPDGGSGSDAAASKTNGKTTFEASCDQPNHDSSSSRQSLNNQMQCSTINTSEQDLDRSINTKMWNHEKRSRVEYHVPSGVDGSLMGWAPSHRSGSEMGAAGLGAVSLTLGLRQSVENAQRPHFGGQIIRDFVG